MERPEEGSPGARYSGAPLMKKELRRSRSWRRTRSRSSLDAGSQSILVMAADKKPVILERALFTTPKDRFYKLAHGG